MRPAEQRLTGQEVRVEVACGGTVGVGAGVGGGGGSPCVR